MVVVTVEEVRGAIDNAEANGHDFSELTDEEIAGDMLAYWSEVGGMEEKDLAKLVHEARNGGV